MANATFPDSLAGLPSCAQGPALLVAQSIEKARCGGDLTCVCETNGFSLILFVGGAITTTCSSTDQDATEKFFVHTCLDLVPSLGNSRAHEILTTCLVLTLLAYLAIILRVISRRISAASYGWDDFLILIALVFQTTFNVLESTATRYGFGKHQLFVSVYEFTQFNKLIITSELCFALSITASKVSLLCTYNRLFRARTFHRMSMAIGAVMIAWLITFLFASIFICTPIKAAWDKTIPNTHCNDLKMEYFAFAGTTLIATFFMGGFVCVAGILRLIFIGKLEFPDVTWSLVEPGFWLNDECSLGIVCVCLPNLRPLLRKYISSSVQARFTNSNNSHHGNLKGSVRLADHSNTPGNRGTMSSSVRGLENVSPGGEAEVGPWKHRKWYASAVPSKKDSGEGGSMEEMVPIRESNLKHEATV